MDVLPASSRAAVSSSSERRTTTQVIYSYILIPFYVLSNDALVSRHNGRSARDGYASARNPSEKLLASIELLWGIHQILQTSKIAQLVAKTISRGIAQTELSTYNLRCPFNSDCLKWFVMTHSARFTGRRRWRHSASSYIYTHPTLRILVTIHSLNLSPCTIWRIVSHRSWRHRYELSILFSRLGPRKKIHDDLTDQHRCRLIIDRPWLYLYHARGSNIEKRESFCTSKESIRLLAGFLIRSARWCCFRLGYVRPPLLDYHITHMVRHLRQWVQEIKERLYDHIIQWLLCLMLCS